VLILPTIPISTTYLQARIYPAFTFPKPINLLLYIQAAIFFINYVETGLARMTL